MAGRWLIGPITAGLWALAAGAQVAAAQVSPHPTSPCALRPDSTLAKTGEALFSSRACIGCHSIGQGKRVGPDLAGVLERRSLDWLRRWIKDPATMVKTDSLAKALLAQSNNVPMPTMRLTDEEVEALLQYVSRESKKAGAKC
jgi:nitrite reductase (NO-forming)